MDIQIIAALTVSIVAVLVNTFAQRGGKLRVGPVDIDKIATAVSAETAGSRVKQTALLADQLELSASRLGHLTAAEASAEFVDLVRKMRDITRAEAITAESTTPGTASSLVRDLVNDYHHQALSQASVQFYFGIVAAVAGFALIAYEVFYSPYMANYGNVQALWSVTPGGIVEAVAALFFKQSSDTRKRATDLYDRLRLDNQQARATEIVATMDDLLMKDFIKSQMALHMAGISVGAVNFDSLAPRAPERPGGNRPATAATPASKAPVTTGSNRTAAQPTPQTVPD